MTEIHHELDDENTIVAAIHEAICKTDLDDCMYDEGPCTKAANAVGGALKGWSIAEHTSNGEDVALLHTCSDEGAGDVVGYVNEETMGGLLRTIAVHDCEEER